MIAGLETQDLDVSAEKQGISPGTRAPPRTISSGRNCEKHGRSILAGWLQGCSTITKQFLLAPHAKARQPTPASTDHRGASCIGVFSGEKQNRLKQLGQGLATCNGKLVCEKARIAPFRQAPKRAAENERCSRVPLWTGGGAFCTCVRQAVTPRSHACSWSAPMALLGRHSLLQRPDGHEGSLVRSGRRIRNAAVVEALRARGLQEVHASARAMGWNVVKGLAEAHVRIAGSVSAFISCHCFSSQGAHFALLLGDV